jgi:hypothetical protein
MRRYDFWWLTSCATMRMARWRPRGGDPWLRPKYSDPVQASSMPISQGREALFCAGAIFNRI